MKTFITWYLIGCAVAALMLIASLYRIHNLNRKTVKKSIFPVTQSWITVILFAYFVIEGYWPDIVKWARKRIEGEEDEDDNQ